jgi:hypothetical protein
MLSCPVPPTGPDRVNNPPVALIVPLSVMLPFTVPKPAIVAPARNRLGAGLDKVRVPPSRVMLPAVATVIGPDTEKVPPAARSMWPFEPTATLPAATVPPLLTVSVPWPTPPTVSAVASPAAEARYRRRPRRRSRTRAKLRGRHQAPAPVPSTCDPVGCSSPIPHRPPVYRTLPPSTRVIARRRHYHLSQHLARQHGRTDGQPDCDRQQPHNRPYKLDDPTVMRIITGVSRSLDVRTPWPDR